MKKKAIALALILAFAAAMLCSCAPATQQDGEQTPQTTPATPAITPAGEDGQQDQTQQQEESLGNNGLAVPSEGPGTGKVLYDYDGMGPDGEWNNTLDFCKDYDLTVVNFWATWCGPCVGEMPELQKVYERFALEDSEAKVGVLGIWIDTENAADKEAVLEYTGVTYPIWELNAQMGEKVDLQYIPATIFLDRDGYLVGEAVVGAHTEEEWLQEIQNRLDSSNSDDDCFTGFT